MELIELDCRAAADQVLLYDAVVRVVNRSTRWTRRADLTEEVWADLIAHHPIIKISDGQRERGSDLSDTTIQWLTSARPEQLVAA